MAIKSIIVVPTLGSKSSEVINDFIIRINDQSIQNIDIVVVNNNTERLSITEKNTKGNIYIINPEKNMGSAGGFYLGMKYAHEQISDYEFMILADDDALILNKEGLESLVLNADNKKITTPYRKELSDFSHKNIATSFSCYGCLSVDIINKFGYYSTLFFYGGEDSAYGNKVFSGGIKVNGVDGTYFSHPCKSFFSSSRGSSGLSTFNFNSILVQLNFIANKNNLLKNSLGIIAQLYLLLYTIIFSNYYFKKRAFTNLINIISYVPIVFEKGIIPRYDNETDEKLTIIDNLSNFDGFFSTDQFKSQIGEKKNLSNKILLIDSWFPVSDRKELFDLVKKLIFQYRIIGFIHEFDSINNIIKYKSIISLKSKLSKILYVILGIILLPIIFLVSIIFYLFILLKFGIIIWNLNKTAEKFATETFKKTVIYS